jgi:hypothetical protein
VIQGFFDDKGKMRAFGAVAIKILSFIAVPLYGIGEHFLRFPDLHTNLRQEGELHRSAVFVDQGFEVRTVKLQVIIFHFKTFLWEIEGLLHQVGVGVIVHRRIQLYIDFIIVGEPSSAKELVSGYKCIFLIHLEKEKPGASDERPANSMAKHSQQPTLRRRSAA